MVGSTWPQSFSVWRCVLLETTLPVTLCVALFMIGGLVPHVPGVATVPGLLIMYTFTMTHILYVLHVPLQHAARRGLPPYAESSVSVMMLILPPLSPSFGSLAPAVRGPVPQHLE